MWEKAALDASAGVKWRRGKWYVCCDILFYMLGVVPSQTRACMHWYIE